MLLAHAAASALLLAAPGTTERAVHLDRARFGFAGTQRLELRLDFDRRPARLEQVLVGIHVVDPVRARGGVRGRRFTGSMRVTRRPDGSVKWAAGRTYPLLVVFCAPRRAGAARAAKGGCTWIRTRVLLRRRA
ncbi:MAG: hypothetical protein HZB46_15660 [Solirubrobacterales bacterium]|nr:hypothetical protein [Solirubrobacterales bacterium]